MAQNNPNNKPPKKFPLSMLYILLIVAMVASFFIRPFEGDASREVNYTTFKQYVGKGMGKSITIDKSAGTATLELTPQQAQQVFPTDMKAGREGVRVTTNVPSMDKVDEFLAANYKGAVKYETGGSWWRDTFFTFFPILILIAFYFFLFNRGTGGAGGGIFSVGKSKAQLFEKGSGLNITFKDVAGQEGAKEEVQEIVDFLKNPSKYTELGGKIPKGALLVGPPGTGKTLLAKAVAGEAHVPFFSMSGSDFVEMFVGVGASRVRDLFRQAKEKAPCIIFIDEIDAVGRARGKNAAMGGNDERENTLNQLLTEMDGFGTNSGVIILAATNRVDILDSALLRAGRFDRQIHVDLPDLNERVAILNVHLRPLKLGNDIDVEMMARQMPGFSGADIANVCNEAALIAARHSHKEVVKQDFLDAVDRVVGGLEKKSKVMTNGEKHTIALHEAGHATVSWLLEHANPLVKVTIVPRGQALGAAWYLPEERNITTKEQMLDEICATLGGRAAEELFTGHISSGALNDLETVTKRAYGMVAYLGMSEKLSNLCYYNNQEYQFSKPYSDKTAELIDAEVHALVNEQYERAKKILSENAEKHNAIARILELREVIYREDVESVLGARPWKSRAEEIMELEAERNAKEAQGNATTEATTAAVTSPLFSASISTVDVPPALSDNGATTPESEATKANDGASAAPVGSTEEEAPATTSGASSQEADHRPTPPPFNGTSSHEA